MNDTQRSQRGWQQIGHLLLLLALLLSPVAQSVPLYSAELTNHGYTLAAPASLPIALPAAQNDEARAIDAGDEAFSPRLEINLGTARDLHLPVEQPYTTTIYVDATLDELDASFFFNGAPDAAQLTLTEPKGDLLRSAPSCESDGVFVSEVDADDQGNTAETATALPGDKTETYDCLDSASDSDVFRVVSLTVRSR